MAQIFLGAKYKTMDMIIDFRTQIHESTIMKEKAVDCVENYKYLGTIIDSKSMFEKNCEAVFKKGHQHLL